MALFPESDMYPETTIFPGQTFPGGITIPHVVAPLQTGAFIDRRNSPRAYPCDPSGVAPAFGKPLR